MVGLSQNRQCFSGLTPGFTLGLPPPLPPAPSPGLQSVAHLTDESAILEYFKAFTLEGLRAHCTSSPDLYGTSISFPVVPDKPCAVTYLPALLTLPALFTYSAH